MKSLQALNEIAATRRQVLRAAGIACVVGGSAGLLTPSEAYAKRVPFTVLSPTEVTTVERLAEAIVPGATEAGISHFIDSQLAVPADESLLVLRYLVPPPFGSFYEAALASSAAALESIAVDDTDALNALVGAIATDKVQAWQGPPSSFFYFVFRTDAIDVVYGSEAGAELLGMPYRAHILPDSPW